MVLFAPLAHLGSLLTGHVRFWLLRDTYEPLVFEMRSAPEATTGWVDARGVAYRLDLGPPVRIAFLWPGGVLDNWCGAVFDPSGAVGTLVATDPAVSDPGAGRGALAYLFGGDLVGCSELDAPYYACCFT